MKSKMNGKTIFFIALICVIVAALVLILISEKHQERVSNIFQAVAIITLVFVTWFYAIHTKTLAEQGREEVKQQMLSRDLKFSEKRIHGFYIPFINSLDYVRKNFENMQISEMKKILDKPHEEIFFRYSYMLSKKTYDAVSDLLIDFGTKAMDENNREIEDKKRNDLRMKLEDIRKRLHIERTKIEEYISENYPFPEKNSDHGNLLG